MKPVKLILLGGMISLSMIVSAQVGSIMQVIPFIEDGKPTGMTWDGENLWVVDYAERSIHKLDHQNGLVLKTIEAPDPMPTGLCWDGEALWCGGYRSRSLYRIDTTGTILDTLEIGKSPRGLTYAFRFLWYLDNNDRSIYKIDPVEGQILDTLPAPGGYSRGLAFTGRYFWVSDSNLDEICCIDPHHAKVIMLLPAPGSYPYGLCYDGGALWVADQTANSLHRISLTGGNMILRLDSLEAHLQYRQMVRNAGNTTMHLNSWICKPYPSIRQVLITSPQFRPEPDLMTSDQWDQEFAYYSEFLQPADSVVHMLDMDIKTYDLRYLIFPDSVGLQSEIPTDILDQYLADGLYYGLEVPILQNAVASAVGEEENLYWRARKIHDYIIENIHYVLDGRWDSAPQVLAQGHGSCSEYSFLFVAMCRAAGIPARYEAGAYFNGSFPYIDEVFHRWSQIYLPPYGWIHVDVTWDDRDYPANQARYFGGTAKTLFATTLSGGGSDLINWSYNSANSQTGGSRERVNRFIWTEKGAVGKPQWSLPNKILSQNYPNPFARETWIPVEVPNDSEVRLTVMNMLGQDIKVLYEGWIPAGEHRFRWNASSEAPGIYLIRLDHNGTQETRACQVHR